MGQLQPLVGRRWREPRAAQHLTRSQTAPLSHLPCHPPLDFTLAVGFGARYVSHHALLWRCRMNACGDGCAVVAVFQVLTLFAVFAAFSGLDTFCSLCSFFF